MERCSSSSAGFCSSFLGSNITNALKPLSLLLVFSSTLALQCFWKSDHSVPHCLLHILVCGRSTGALTGLHHERRWRCARRTSLRACLHVGSDSSLDLASDELLITAVGEAGELFVGFCCGLVTPHGVGGIRNDGER